MNTEVEMPPEEPIPPINPEPSDGDDPEGTDPEPTDGRETERGTLADWLRELFGGGGDDTDGPPPDAPGDDGPRDGGGGDSPAPDDTGFWFGGGPDGGGSGPGDSCQSVLAQIQAVRNQIQLLEAQKVQIGCAGRTVAGRWQRAIRFGPDRPPLDYLETIPLEMDELAIDIACVLIDAQLLSLRRQLRELNEQARADGC